MVHLVETLEKEDIRAAVALFWASLGLGAPPDDRLDRLEAAFEPGRSLGIRDGGALVAGTWSFGCRTVVPGGAVLSAGGVSRVGVRADRTRRGLLTALMRAQLADLRDRGEVLASLRASEARIYGRFGYGVATRARTVRVRRIGSAGFRPGAPAGGSVRMLEPADAVSVLAPLHKKIALVRTGGVTRTREWWDSSVEQRVRSREHVLAVVHTGAEGDDGFAVGHFRSDGPFQERVLQVDDLHTTGLDATAALWRFLLGVDLVGAVEAEYRPLDESLELLLTDPRDLATTAIEDETWLRLVDVPTALAARSFTAAAPVTIAVHDALLEDNTGVYRVAGGTAERIGPLGAHPEPELQCDVAGLAMAYLGDRSPSQLLATGWWRGDSAAARRADTAFAVEQPSPWCGTFF